MKHTVRIHEQKVEFELRQRKLSKRLRLSVDADGCVAVSAPNRASLTRIKLFIESNADWLLLRLAEIAARPAASKPKKHSTKEIALYKKQARTFVHQRIIELNKIYGFRFGSIAIRNQKSRWGSCSKKGNVNFNYRIVLLPPEHADYIIVHELCHLKEFNHSKKFWNLVAIGSPNYIQLRKDLRSSLGNPSLL
jgi:predicted metal-dependent hydrolase